MMMKKILSWLMRPFLPIQRIFDVPGSAPWLLKHELRLAWRGIKMSKTMWIILLVVWLLVHALAFFLVFAVSKGVEAGLTLPPVATQITGVVVWLFFTIALSQTLALSVTAFFTRGDLDLLFSSPLDAKVVLTVRTLGIGCSAILLPIMVLLPFAHVGVLAGKPSLMLIYPALVAFGMLAAAVGVWLTMLLVKLLGARRARTAAQLLGAFVGAGFFLLTQAQNFLSKPQRNALGTWIKNEAQPGGVFELSSILWWPARAFLGELIPALAFFGVATLLFWLVVNFTYKRFVLSSQESMVGGKTAPVMANDARPQFSTGLTWVLLRKEWKLIWRDPQLISQTLLQVLYMMPMLFLGFTSKHMAVMLVPGAVVIVAMLVGNLAWLTIAAEDAPELLASSPASLNRVRAIKGLAAMIPALLLIAPLIVYWLIAAPWQGVVLALCASGAAATTAACNILNPRQGDRREMNKRGKSQPLASTLEGLSAVAWGGIAFGFIGTWWALIIAVPIAVLGPMYSFYAGAGKRKMGLLT